MKKEFIISAFLWLFGSHDSFCQKASEAESFSEISFSDLEEKVFDFGSLNNFTDSCAFYFECDCCSGNFLFNSDSSYLFVSSCLNSETLSSGKFDVNHDTLSLISNEVSLTRRLDEWKMELSGEVEYYFTDTVNEVNRSQYKLSRCDGKIMLTNIHEPTLAVETQENIKDQLESLQKKGFLKRWEELEANSEELNKTSFSYLINKINRYLNFYSLLDPLGDREYDIRELDLSKEELMELRETTDLDTNNYLVDGSTAIHVTMGKILELLDKVLEHEEVVEHDLTNLFHEELRVVKSEDDKLFHISLDEKTGGTFRTGVSLLQYRSSKDSVTIWTTSGDQLQNIHEAASSGNFLEQIKTIETKEGKKYLLFGSVRGCSYCFEANISLVHFSNDEMNTDFYHSIAFRDWETSRLTFDEETMTITANYTTSDLTTECKCNDEESLEPYDIDTFRPKRCKCIFKFNGRTFEIIEKDSEPINDE